MISGWPADPPLEMSPPESRLASMLLSLFPPAEQDAPSQRPRGSSMPSTSLHPFVGPSAPAAKRRHVRCSENRIRQHVYQIREP